MSKGTSKGSTDEGGYEILTNCVDYFGNEDLLQIDQADKWGYSSLLYSANYGFPKTARELIYQGANVN